MSSWHGTLPWSANESRQLEWRIVGSILNRLPQKTHVQQMPLVPDRPGAAELLTKAPPSLPYQRARISRGPRASHAGRLRGWSVHSDFTRCLFFAPPNAEPPADITSSSPCPETIHLSSEVEPQRHVSSSTTLQDSAPPFVGFQMFATRSVPCPTTPLRRHHLNAVI